MSSHARILLGPRALSLVAILALFLSLGLNPSAFAEEVEGDSGSSEPTPEPEPEPTPEPEPEPTPEPEYVPPPEAYEGVGGWAVVDPVTGKVHGVVVCSAASCGPDGSSGGVTRSEYMGCPAGCVYRFQSKAQESGNVVGVHSDGLNEVQWNGNSEGTFNVNGRDLTPSKTMADGQSIYTGVDGYDPNEYEFDPDLENDGPKGLPEEDESVEVEEDPETGVEEQIESQGPQEILDQSIGAGGTDLLVVKDISGQISLSIGENQNPDGLSVLSALSAQATENSPSQIASALESLNLTASGITAAILDFIEPQNITFRDEESESPALESAEELSDADVVEAEPVLQAPSTEEPFSVEEAPSVESDQSPVAETEIAEKPSRFEHLTLSSLVAEPALNIAQVIISSEVLDGDSSKEEAQAEIDTGATLDSFVEFLDFTELATDPELSLLPNEIETTELEIDQLRFLSDARAGEILEVDFEVSGADDVDYSVLWETCNPDRSECSTTNWAGRLGDLPMGSTARNLGDGSGYVVKVTIEAGSGDNKVTSELYSNVVATSIVGEGQINPSDSLEFLTVGRAVSVNSPSGATRHSWYSCSSEPNGAVSQDNLPPDCMAVPFSGESNALYLSESVAGRYLLVLAEVGGVWSDDGSSGSAIVGYKSVNPVGYLPPRVNGFPSIFAPRGYLPTEAGGWQPTVSAGQIVSSSVPRLLSSNSGIAPVTVEIEWKVCKSRKWSSIAPTPSYGGAWVGWNCESRSKSVPTPYSSSNSQAISGYTVGGEDAGKYLVSKTYFSTGVATSARESEPILIVE